MLQQIFQKTMFHIVYVFWRATFSEKLFFLLQTFSEEELFHSYTYYPQLHFLFIAALAIYKLVINPR